MVRQEGSRYRALLGVKDEGVEPDFGLTKSGSAPRALVGGRG